MSNLQERFEALSEEEQREARKNLAKFFQILHEWDLKHKQKISKE